MKSQLNQHPVRQIKTSSLGFPRIGSNRELKKALESYWNDKCSESELLLVSETLRKQNWMIQKEVGLDFIPSNDFSLYDQVLDMTVMLGAIPERYRSIEHGLTRYFAMARGIQDATAGIDLPAMEMTKWFDTNYHYIVPELDTNQKFSLDARKILLEIREARALEIETRPVILGPISFLLLSKLATPKSAEAAQIATLDLLGSLLPVYQELMSVLESEKVKWVQMDEPCLVLELDDRSRQCYKDLFLQIASWKNRPKILLATYFGALNENLELVAQSKCEALHVDLVRAPEQLTDVLDVLSTSETRTSLSLGLVDGRNIWRTDLDAAHSLVRKAVLRLGGDRVCVAPSCSLLHVPVDLRFEKKLDEELKSWLSFAVQKIREVSALADSADSELPTADLPTGDLPAGDLVEANRKALLTRRSSSRVRDEAVRKQVEKIETDWLGRGKSYSVRAERQKNRLCLPDFPTTTIGSFPQTEEVRKFRAAWRSGKIHREEYDRYLKEEIQKCIQAQESIGLDVLVHGEFERTDMVEYFGEKLRGFAFTSNGWVQSYGSRCVKPPVIYGDVSRPEPMTVEWTVYAQSLTKKPVKGMLTGPVTLLQWSFVRDDQPRSVTCTELGLALREEVRDLEAAGISVIQVDEPAIREGLPLRRSEWKSYLRWAVDAFKLATSGVREDTQIHTHMCYSEFGDILDSVADMDADVLSIETSRSRMELLDDFQQFHYPNDIGPGVYDIHSPRVPTSREIVVLLLKAVQVVPPHRLWVNPDCGLKTRGWSEVQSALKNMVDAAKTLRRGSQGRPTKEYF